MRKKQTTPNSKNKGKENEDWVSVGRRIRIGSPWRPVSKVKGYIRQGLETDAEIWKS